MRTGSLESAEQAGAGARWKPTRRGFASGCQRPNADRVWFSGGGTETTSANRRGDHFATVLRTRQQRDLSRNPPTERNATTLRRQGEIADSSPRTRLLISHLGPFPAASAAQRIRGNGHNQDLAEPRTRGLRDAGAGHLPPRRVGERHCHPPASPNSMRRDPPRSIRHQRRWPHPSTRNHGSSLGVVESAVRNDNVRRHTGNRARESSVGLDHSLAPRAPFHRVENATHPSGHRVAYQGHRDPLAGNHRNWRAPLPHRPDTCRSATTTPRSRGVQPFDAEM